MARSITPERQGLRTEAIRLRKVGWGIREIGRALAIPHPTIHVWITDHSKADASGQQCISDQPLQDSMVNNSPPSITLFPCKYEEAVSAVGYPEQPITRKMLYGKLRRYKCGRTFRDYYLLEEKGVCARCAVKEDGKDFDPGTPKT